MPKFDWSDVDIPDDVPVRFDNSSGTQQTRTCSEHLPASISELGVAARESGQCSHPSELRQRPADSVEQISLQNAHGALCLVDLLGVKMGEPGELHPRVDPVPLSHPHRLLITRLYVLWGVGPNVRTCRGPAVAESAPGSLSPNHWNRMVSNSSPSVR